ncbi:MAG TPA: helix-turn-helix domain-containing protein [Microvirga sp.]|nr:helix-turn-helix domain-containing protein [Microvirga sp.]
MTAITASRAPPSASRSRRVTIGGLSERTGVNIETIRYYERIRLLPPPPRTDGGQRSYDESHLKRLTFIRRARELGFPIDDIRGLLSLADRHALTCGEVQSLAERHLAEVRAKILDLRRLERAIRQATATCAGGTVPECPVVDVLYDTRAQPRRASAGRSLPGLARPGERRAGRPASSALAAAKPKV